MTIKTSKLEQARARKYKFADAHRLYLRLYNQEYRRANTKRFALYRAKQHMKKKAQKCQDNIKK